MVVWEGGSGIGDGTGNAKAQLEMLSGNVANALVIIGLLGGVAVSTFSKTLAMLFGLLVFGVQVCRSAHGAKDTRKADVRTVSGFARIQCHTDNETATICKGNRPEVGSRRQCGVQTQLWVDLCIGVNGVLLICKIWYAKASE